MVETFKVIIAGGRDFDDYIKLKKSCDRLLANKDNIEIVSGTAKGADIIGERYADLWGYKLTRFPADWDQHGKAAGHIRNRQMAEYADALIIFWDGSSRGSRNMIDEAKKKGLQIRVIEYGDIAQ